jgi:restriction endonuclease SmaI-like protein
VSGTIRRVADPEGIFDEGFLASLEISVKIHHQLYPIVPPQGIYFEALVERSFRAIKKPYAMIQASNRNLAGHDLLVEGKRISLKTETGASTKANRITITKLCTTEKEPWDAPTLIARVLDHLSRYELILMLRSIWERPLIRYQLIEIPIDTLRLIETAHVETKGTRKGRQSLGAKVTVNDQVLFSVFFDASDGKCAIRGLRVSDCVMLREWEVKVD